MSIRIILLLAFVILTDNTGVFGQTVDSIHHKSHKSHKPPKPPIHRYGLWFTPVGRTTTIDGIAFGLVALPFGHGKMFLNVNGINIEANPIPLMVIPIVFLGGLMEPFKPKHHSEQTATDIFHNALRYVKNDTPKTAIVRGLSISTGGMGERTMNGVELNLLSLENEMNGVEVSAFINNNYCIRGLMVAGIANIATTGKGVQIGLFNKCKEGKALQIGLLNRIGKRTIPLINFCFKKPNKSP